jgi:hypothetical protein
LFVICSLRVHSTHATGRHEDAAPWCHLEPGWPSPLFTVMALKLPRSHSFAWLQEEGREAMGGEGN